MSTWEKYKDKFSNPIFHYGVGKEMCYRFELEMIFSFSAICSFTASSPDQLSLLLGDSVHVREEYDGNE